jgi:ATP-dependent RNA helicase DDX47/RRP3
MGAKPPADVLVPTGGTANAGDQPRTHGEQPASNAAETTPTTTTTFAALGVCDELCDACLQMGYSEPTPIQTEAIPLALAGKDVIGLAQTGSGKTAAFAIPILQALLTATHAGAAGGRHARAAAASSPFAVVVAPTRELVFQIQEQFDALGAGIGASTIAIAGGVDSMAQAVALAKRPHIIVATPGRLVDHLENTKGFSLRAAKYLVLDEADRILTLDFEKELDKIVNAMPRDRTSFLFSATMTSKVRKLQRASLKDPARVEVSDKYATVDTLVQHFVFVPDKHKDCYLAYLLTEFAGNSAIVFVDTQKHAQRIALLLRAVSFSAVCIHGGMGQPKRLAALSKFKAGQRTILVATDVASRGLDIPRVDIVINYDIPSNGKDYVHRVGRTARAGRAGRALNIVSQYDLHNYREVEELIGKKLDRYPHEESTVLLMLPRIAEAQRIAAAEMRELAEKQKGRGKRGRGVLAGDDDHEKLAEEVGNEVSQHVGRSRTGGRAMQKKRRR